MRRERLRAIEGAPVLSRAVSSDQRPLERRARTPSRNRRQPWAKSCQVWAETALLRSLSGIGPADGGAVKPPPLKRHRAPDRRIQLLRSRTRHRRERPLRRQRPQGTSGPTHRPVETLLQVWHRASRKTRRPAVHNPHRTAAQPQRHPVRTPARSQELYGRPRPSGNSVADERRGGLRTFLDRCNGAARRSDDRASSPWCGLACWVTVLR